MNNEKAQILASRIRVLIPNNLDIPFDDVEVGHSPIEGSPDKVIRVYLDKGAKVNGRYVMISEAEDGAGYYVGLYHPDGYSFVTTVGEDEVVKAIRMIGQGEIVGL